VERNGQGNYTVVFLYCSDELQSVRLLFWTTMIVGLLSILTVFLLVVFFSKKAVRPVAESIERQRQFITDASHEIKTPLGILSANNDVLALEYGENEWIVSSRRQAERLAGLVNSMVTLSRLDEEKPRLEQIEFSLSDAVLDTVADFEGPAETQRKKLTSEVQPDIKVWADEGAIRQLLAILLDNALKYSNNDGEIRVTLLKRKKTAVLEVFNTCEPLNTENLERFFDRFFRADSARSAKSGYGIGLSIAKAITEAHEGTISVHSEDGKSIRFTVEL